MQLTKGKRRMCIRQQQQLLLWLWLWSIAEPHLVPSACSLPSHLMSSACAPRPPTSALAYEPCSPGSPGAEELSLNYFAENNLADKVRGSKGSSSGGRGGPS